MYSDFFGFRCPPFEDVADTQFFYASPDREETLAALEYETHHTQGMGLVIGEAGTGKTIMIRTLLLRLFATDHVVVVTCPAGGAHLIRETCNGFGVTDHRPKSQSHLLKRLRRALIRNAEADHNSILIIDQAENLSERDLAQLASLADLEENDRRLLAILLVGQPHFEAMLDRPELARTRQRLFGKRLLTPLSLIETEHYIQHRLRIAGAGETDLFDSDATAAIHAATDGIPRLITRACDAALLIAYGGGDRRVTRAIALEAMGTETDVPVQTPDFMAPESIPPVATNPAEEMVVSHELPTQIEYTPPEPVPPTIGMTTPPNEAFLERLERTLARAERVNATQEAALIKHQAIETHLAKLADSAGRLAGRLSSGMETAGEVLAQHEQRSQIVAADAAKQIECLESRAAEVMERTSAISGQVDRIDEAFQHAEGIEGTLASFAEQIADKAQEVQERVKLLMAGVEEGDQTNDRLSATIKSANIAAEAMQETLTSQEAQRIECTHASERKLHTLLESASSFAENFDTHVKSLQSKLQSAVDEAESLQQRMTIAALNNHRQQLEEQTQGHRLAHKLIAERAEERVGALQTQLESMIQETQGLQQRMTTKALDDHRKKFDELANSHLRTQETITESGELAMKGLQEKVSSASQQAERLRESCSEATLKRYANTIDEKFRSHEREGLKATQAALSLHSSRLDTMIADSQEQAEAIEQRHATVQAALTLHTSKQEASIANFETQTEAMEQRQANVQSSLAMLTDGLKATTSRSDALADRVQALGTTIDNLTRRSETTQQNLSSASHRGEQMIEGVQVACGQVEAVQHTVATELVEIGSACERIQAAREHARDCEAITKQLAFRQDDGEKLSDHLGKLIETAGDVNETMQWAASETESKIGQLDSHQAAAGEILARLNDATVGAHRLHESLRDQTNTAHTLMDSGSDQVDQLTTATVAASRAAKPLEALVASASNIEKSGRDTCAETLNVIERLQGQLSTAARLNEVLEENGTTGSELVEKAAETLSALQQTTDDANRQEDQLTQQAASIESACLEKLETLTECNALAASYTEQLGAAFHPAEQLAGELENRIRDARHQNKTLHENQDKTDKLIRRLPRVTRILSAAKKTQEEVSATLHIASNTHEQLSTTLKTTQARQDALISLNELAEKVIQRQAEETEKGQAQVETLRDQLQATREASETTETILHEFVAQAQRVEEHLLALRHQANQVETSIEKAMDEPARIVTAAQAQAAQLERVCEAVRKVFGGLSRASLDAGKRMKQCQQASEETTALIAEVTMQKKQAASTLREWIDEAMRAQTRLQRTLEQAPTIEETHPGRILSTGNGIADLVGRRIGQTQPKGKLEMLPDPAATAKPNAPQPITVGHGVTIGQGVLKTQRHSATSSPAKPSEKPTTRAEELARMIQQARQTAEQPTR